MDVITKAAAMNDWSLEQSRRGRTIALVPTMGFFHEGHLSLMRMAADHADEVVVSLFVNPMQFGVNEDLDRYPRNFHRDSDLAEKERVSLLFTPEPEEMYPRDFQTAVSVDTLSRHLCGASRPGHFTGVATVVCKLFHMVGPDCAVFGQKDFQQLAIIRQMVRDLNMNVRILAHPIVREKDGLAMSSRNSYLDEEQRKSALGLSKAIELARLLYRDGLRDIDSLKKEVNREILSFAGTRIEYVEFVDQTTLESVQRADDNTLLALAVTIDNRVRLIDNGLLALPLQQGS